MKIANLEQNISTTKNPKKQENYSAQIEKLKAKIAEIDAKIKEIREKTSKLFDSYTYDTNFYLFLESVEALETETDKMLKDDNEEKEPSKEPDQKVEQIDNSIFSGKIGSIIKILINDSLVYDKDLVEPLKKMKSDSQAIFYITKIKKELAKETPDKNILREMKTKLNGIFLKIK